MGAFRKLDDLEFIDDISEYFSKALNEELYFKMLYSEIEYTGDETYQTFALDDKGVGYYKDQNEQIGHMREIHVPVLMKKEDIDKLNTDGINFSFDGRVVDIGHLDNNTCFKKYSARYLMFMLEPIINDYLPDNCIYVDNELLCEYARSRGYSELFWDAKELPNHKYELLFFLTGNKMEVTDEDIELRDSQIKTKSLKHIK